ncbi:hypothetical protein B0G76_0710 [Paraburkholderia sp. BL23I1N1]|uniref:hypothetical protein n=1 Tax=Paraburkholderia sp. BL23I1N1 TaxID=1938802 RepID=UPI000FF4512B|nr:hypothetical protein [Paraburkholderia sp. BL23I1N1]RKE34691.1 hypothetical protein B0G76_0710 [Paraburkholderia sp. BL23I1N1]
MKELLTFALNNPALLVVPAVGFVLSLVVVRIKRRYVNEGVLFRRKPARQRDHNASKSAEKEMNADNDIDLEIALRKLHELGLEDGDLGYAYWYQVGQLLKRAAGMQALIDALSEELEQSRAARPKPD